MKYIVKRGDTLSSIAEKYGTTVKAIQQANSHLIKNVNVIQIGWSLTIPETNKKDYSAIGKQLEKCLKDIENLDSFQKLLKMI